MSTILPTGFPWLWSIYEHNPEFQEYTERMAHLRGTQALGKMSHVLPTHLKSLAKSLDILKEENQI